MNAQPSGGGKGNRGTDREEAPARIRFLGREALMQRGTKEWWNDDGTGNARNEGRRNHERRECGMEEETSWTEGMRQRERREDGVDGQGTRGTVESGRIGAGNTVE